MKKKISYSWVRYKKAFWVNENGQKLYKGTFEIMKDLHNFSRVEFMFWASRPGAAMKSLTKKLNNGAALSSLDWAVIN